jgi:glycosyltransferase involved in cell wall biosynthesis
VVSPAGEAHKSSHIEGVILSHLTVSVVIPTYNRAHLIGRALDSVLGQVEPGDEVIVIDDGSSDNTKDVVESYGDKVRFVRITNSGAGAARNRGIREAKNALVAFLDSDDEWMAGKLALQRKLMAARPDVLFCFSDISITTKRGGIVRNYLRFWHNDRRGWDQILNPGVPYSSIVGPPEARDDFMVHTGQLYASLAKAILPAGWRRATRFAMKKTFRCTRTGCASPVWRGKAPAPIWTWRPPGSTLIRGRG